MTMNYYTKKLKKLARYAPEDVDNKKKKQERFMNEVHMETRTQFISHVYPDFNTLVNKDILTEDARTELLSHCKCKFEARQIKQQERSQRSRSNFSTRPRY